MKLFILLFFTSILLNSEGLMLSFKDKEDVSKWFIINDGVMGGLSRGYLKTTEEGIRFYGNVSLENNGGFTSYRSPYTEFDLSVFKTVEIKYRSTGGKMAFQLEKYRRFYLPNYKIDLEVSDEWTVKQVNLLDFKQYQLGTPNGLSLKEEVLTEIIRIGFVTNEKRPVDFDFEVAYIKFN